MNASLKRVLSIFCDSDSWMWIIDACEKAASSLCVECVANTSGCLERGMAARHAHRVAARVELVERGVGVPGLVEVQRVDADCRPWT